MAALLLYLLCITASGDRLLRGVQGRDQDSPGGLLDSAEGQLKALVERFWSWRLQESPEYGTKIEIRDYEDRLEELTEEAFQRRKGFADEMLQEASNIAHDDLDADTRVTLALLKYTLQTFVNGFPYRRMSQYNPVSPMGDPLLDLHSTLRNMASSTENDYRLLLTRLAQFPRKLNETIQLMRESIRTGQTLHNASLTGVAERMVAEVASGREAAVFEYFLDIPESIDMVTRSEIMENGSSIIEGAIFPALLKFANFLSEEYAPHTRPDVGVWSLDGGSQYYRECLKWHLTLDMSAEQVHQIGLEEVARITELMTEEKERDGFHGDLLSYKYHLLSQPENFYQSGEEMIAGYQEIVKATHKNMNKLFHNVLDIPCVVIASSNRQNPTGRYSNPARDGSRPGFFVANVYGYQAKPKFNMAALTLHEAEPGHHLMATMEIARLQQAELTPFQFPVEFRRYYAIPFNFPFFTAMSEGWALYAESLGKDLGAYDAPHALFGSYASEMFRAVRLVVDTGIHVYRWGKPRAMEYMANHTTLSAMEIENEVNRYISWPGQACSYKIGELKIKELKKRAQESLGDEFDIRDFHSKILDFSRAPLSIIEDHINNWIEAEMSGATRIEFANKILLVMGCITLAIMH